MNFNISNNIAVENLFPVYNEDNHIKVCVEDEYNEAAFLRHSNNLMLLLSAKQEYALGQVALISNIASKAPKYRVVLEKAVAKAIKRFPAKAELIKSYLNR